MINVLTSRDRAINVLTGKKNPKPKKSFTRAEAHKALDLMATILQNEGKWELNYRQLKAHFDSLELEAASLRQAVEAYKTEIKLLKRI